MGLLNRKEHLNCFNYDHSKHPQIEVIRIAKGQKSKLQADCSEVIFFLEGRVKFILKDYPEQERLKGQFQLLPAGGSCTYTACCHTEVMIFRLYDNLQLCLGFKIEWLYGIQEIRMESNYKPRKALTALEINPRLWQFLENINDCLKDGVRCRTYLDLKVKEFLIQLRLYYPKDQLHDFFYLILSPDMVFSEYVKKNWRQYPTVIELAASIPLSLRQFNRRFKQVFSTTPYKWMKEGKAQHILKEIGSMSKSFKQIALENGFSTVQQFTKFCQTELGDTPTQIRNKEKRKLSDINK